MSLPFRLLSVQLQQQLRQAGVYLESLEQTEQIQERFGDNNSERTNEVRVFEERKEEENNMATTTEKTHEKQTVDSPPPAGGTENARALADLLKKVGDAADRAAPKKVSERVVEAAIPTGIAVAGVLIAWGGYTFIENQWGRLGMMKKAAALDAMNSKAPQLES